MDSGEVNNEPRRRLAERVTDRVGHSWCAEHVDHIAHGQHHEPVAPAFPHLEAVVVGGDGGEGWFGRMIDHCGTPF